MDEVDALIYNSIMAASTENSVVFHVMGNRFSVANPGSCVPGDELRIFVEEDHQGRSTHYGSIDCTYI